MNPVTFKIIDYLVRNADLEDVHTFSYLYFTPILNGYLVSTFHHIDTPDEIAIEKKITNQEFGIIE